MFYQLIVITISFILICESINLTDYDDDETELEPSVDGPMSPRIIFGQKVLSHKQDYPYVVSINILFEGELRVTCGGSIINPEIIITAAHCFTKSMMKEISLIRPNYDNSLTRFDDEKYFKIKSVECYDANVIHDICLLQLTNPIPFGHGIGPIELANKQYEPGSDLTIIGFGGTEYDSFSFELRTAEVKRLSDETCHEKYLDSFVHELMICAVGSNLEDSCRGDSGGPMVDATDQHHVLVGIVAWGAICGQGWPGVYTNVYHYLDWINKTMDSLLTR